MTRTSQVLLCAKSLADLDALREVLRVEPIDTFGHLIEFPDPEGPARFQLIVIDGHGCLAEAIPLCRRLHHVVETAAVPILFLSDETRPPTRQSILESGADACLPFPFTAFELRLQMCALLRLQSRYHRLTDKTLELQRIGKQLNELHQQIEQDHEMARCLQRRQPTQGSLITPGASIAYRTIRCGPVGGDFHDIVRHDEEHVSIYVADTLSHGISAALLSLFVKQALPHKECTAWSMG